MEDIHGMKSFNWNTGVYTLLFFLLGLLYYLYKFYNFRNAVNDNMIPNRDVQNRDNISSSNNNNNDNINNTSNQQNNTNLQDCITIKVLVSNQRETLTLHKDIILRNLAYSNLSSYFNPSYQSVHLIYQGTRLDLTKKLSYYPQIKNEAILHCFITNLHSNRNGENRSNSNNRYANYNSQMLSNENTITMPTIILHTCFTLIGIILISIYKKFPEVFSNSAIICFSVIYIFWLNQLSKVLAKFIIFRQLDWSF